MQTIGEQRQHAETVHAIRELTAAVRELTEKVSAIMAERANEPAPGNKGSV